MGTEGPSKWRVSSSASSRVCRELSQNQPLGSSAVQGRRHRLQKGLAKGEAEGKRAYVAEETQFGLGVKRVSNKIIECLEDAGGEMSLKDLREGRINSRDKRKGRNIFVAAIEFLTKNKRIEETGRAAGSCCGCWERVLANESERGRDGCRPEGQRDGGTRLRKIRSEPSGASLVPAAPTAASFYQYDVPVRSRRCARRPLEVADTAEPPGLGRAARARDAVKNRAVFASLAGTVSSLRGRLGDAHSGIAYAESLIATGGDDDVLGSYLARIRGGEFGGERLAQTW